MTRLKPKMSLPYPYPYPYPAHLIGIPPSQLHSHALKLSLLTHPLILSTLLRTYPPTTAQTLLLSLFPNPPTPIPFTILSSSFLSHNLPSHSLKLFHLMLSLSVPPDAPSFSSALSSCLSLREIQTVLRIASRFRLLDHPLVANAALAAFFRCNEFGKGFEWFAGMETKDVVSWTVVVNRCVRSGRVNEALGFFREMCGDGVRPDCYAVSAVLPACGRVAEGRRGKEVHAVAVRRGFEWNYAVGNALVDMYVKSGFVELGMEVFWRMPRRDCVAWTVAVLGLSLHGYGDRAVELFTEMESCGRVEMDRVAVDAVLHACRTAVLVDEGRFYFERVASPRIEHFAAMVGILARAGRFEEAQVFAADRSVGMRVEVLRAVLDGCRVHRNVRLGKRIAEELLELEPLNAENYVLLSNLHAANKNWDVVDGLRQTIRDMGLKTRKAFSWIEIRNKVHVFGVGDVSHPRSEGIYWELKCLMKRMEDEGLQLNEDFSLHDVDEERECIPYSHSEMLAVALGLISVKGNGAIQVVKNARVCRNCHSSLKMISNIIGREIVVKDPERFHHFKDGCCSCKDVW